MIWQILVHHRSTGIGIQKFQCLRSFLNHGLSTYLDYNSLITKFKGSFSKMLMLCVYVKKISQYIIMRLLNNSQYEHRLQKIQCQSECSFTTSYITVQTLCVEYNSWAIIPTFVKIVMFSFCWTCFRKAVVCAAVELYCFERITDRIF